MRVLGRLPVYLTRELEVQVTFDHVVYWAWSGEVFHRLRFVYGFIGDDVWRALETLFHAALMKLGYAPSTPEAQVLNRIVDLVVDRHVRHVVYEKYLVAAALSFFVLEALLRGIYLWHVKPKGDEARRVERHWGLGALVREIEESRKAFPQQMIRDLYELLNVVATIWGSEAVKPRPKHWREVHPGWRVLLEWRNSLLHGRRTLLPRAFAVAMNTICLIMWHYIPPEKYEAIAKEILRDAEWRAKTMNELGEIAHLHSFYPP